MDTVISKLSIPVFEKLDYYSVLEVTLPRDEDFLCIIETLTRIGIPNNSEKKLVQSCLCLHKRGRYYLVHFLEMFALSGKATTISHEDIQRRNLIAKLLEQWGLLEIVDKKILEDVGRSSLIKIIPHKEKKDWILESKFTIGKKNAKSDQE